MMVQIIELRPSRELLNVDFEKYQFSSEPITISDEIVLSTNVSHREPSPGQDSLLEARLFGFHNHLYRNPFDDCCWFFDEAESLWCLNENSKLRCVYAFNSSGNESSYNCSIAFASEKIIVFGNGGSSYCMLIINNGQEKVIPITDADPGILMDAQYIDDKKLVKIGICCIVEEKGKKRSKIILLSYLLNLRDNIPGVLNLYQRQELLVYGAIDYLYIEPSGDYINMLSQDNPKFIFDSLKSIVEEGSENSNKKKLKIPKYYWSQDEDSLTVWLKIPNEYRKLRPNIKITPTAISIQLEDIVLIQGEFQFRLEGDTATWTMEKDALKLELIKNESGQMWNELIKGDTGGEHLPNETLAAEIHTRLSHLCTDQPQDEQPAIGFNAEQLEECDLGGDQNNFQRIDIQDHGITHSAILGTHNHVLFTQKLEATQLLCIRQEHDGCVWQVSGNEDNWLIRHKATFPGFGYVEASKSNKKFCISPPNCRYVVIVEHSRHAFIYQTPCLNDKVGKQKIVDLGTDAFPIVGAIATNDHLILLTKNKLYKLRIEI